VGHVLCAGCLYAVHAACSRPCVPFPVSVSHRGRGPPEEWAGGTLAVGWGPTACSSHHSRPAAGKSKRGRGTVDRRLETVVEVATEKKVNYGGRLCAERIREPTRARIHIDHTQTHRRASRPGKTSHINPDGHTDIQTHRRTRTLAKEKTRPPERWRNTAARPTTTWPHGSEASMGRLITTTGAVQERGGGCPVGGWDRFPVAVWKEGSFGCALGVKNNPGPPLDNPGLGDEGGCRLPRASAVVGGCS